MYSTSHLPMPKFPKLEGVCDSDLQTSACKEFACCAVVIGSKNKSYGVGIVPNHREV